MNAYEGTFILGPDFEEEALTKAVSEIEAVITKNGGKIENSKKEGKKALAYSIRKKPQGFQCLIDFSLAPDKIAVINNAFKLNENIYRYMFTKKEPKKNSAPEAARVVSSDKSNV